MSAIKLDSPLQYIKGVGPKRAEILADHGINNVRDLLFYFPRSYLDRTTVLPIGEIRIDDKVTIIGKVRAHGQLPGRKGRRYEVILGDETGDITLVFFEGVHWWRSYFKKGMVLAATGQVKYYRTKQMVHPDMERLESDSDKMIHAGRIIPVYPQTAELTRVGLSSKSIRNITTMIFENLRENIPDFLPPVIIQEYKFPTIHEAISKLHYPDNRDEIEICRQRMAFDELLSFQYLIDKRKEQKTKISKQHSFEKPADKVNSFRSDLPFELTPGQIHSINQIFDDLQSTHPMSRLLQGDVGCGKTVVAILSAVYSAENKLQTAFMAPTEILAEQHYRNWHELLKKLGISSALVTSATKGKEKTEISQKCAKGELDILIGTHALIYEYMTFNKLGLVIIDEQHRFGVEQRGKLYSKGDNPDLLVMTATPIPRTLALTLYGDLEISTIDTMPAGRKPIKTVWRDSESRDKVYQYVRDEIKKGGQAYIIYPLIEKSDKMELRSVEDAFKELASGVFSECQTGMIHGRVKSAEKERVLKKFRNGTLDILFATTVIEVGIDNPNATIMVIEHAERFGLAQLHQLRGRVGRGAKESLVVAIAHTPLSVIAEKRLGYFASTADGFKIAEADLELRGPGEVFGVRQSGIPEFRAANIARDQNLIELSRNLLTRLNSNGGQLAPDYEKIRNYLERVTRPKLENMSGG
jgi:ATP-dependent DNA helicase RecG